MAARVSHASLQTLRGCCDPRKTIWPSSTAAYAAFSVVRYTKIDSRLHQEDLANYSRWANIGPFQRASRLTSTRLRSTSRTEVNSWLRLQSLSVCVEESWQYLMSLQRESRGSTTQAWWPNRDSKRQFTRSTESRAFRSIACLASCLLSTLLQ